MTTRTLRIDEAAQIINKHGQATIVEGPRSIFVWPSQDFRMLQRYNADQNQYIVVHKRDGNIEHIPGPCVKYHDPITMESVAVKSATALDANEVLVIYRYDKESQKVSRRIQHGPCVYFPAANEWLHNFVWHGNDPRNKTRKIPGVHKFNKLRVIPDQFYYNCEEVRTKDDALLTVKVMMFFEMRNIETMLNQTIDPIGDFINSLQADIIAFASQLRYEEFVDSIGKLNQLESYQQLVERSRKVGYEVTKVINRGYHTTDRLQKLHDQAVEKRSTLKVAMDSEQQQQDLTDYKLHNEQQQNAIKQALELDSAKHQYQLQKSQLLHTIKLSSEQQLEVLEREKAKKLSELYSQKVADEERLAHYADLKKLGVDLTSYFVSQNPKPEHIIRVVSTGGKGSGSAIHVHP
ncbi:hypothetical protein EMCRGX_G025226 [Ephydatia muelleri]